MLFRICFGAPATKKCPFRAQTRTIVYLCVPSVESSEENVSKYDFWRKSIWVLLVPRGKVPKTRNRAAAAAWIYVANVEKT